MKLKELISLLQDELDRVGDVEAFIESEYDEEAIERVHSFHVHSDPSKPVLVAISSREND